MSALSKTAAVSAVSPSPKTIASPTTHNMPREISEKLAALQKMINERKSLFDRQKENKAQVFIAMQELRTRDGESLDSLRQSAANTYSSEQIEELMEKLEEIEKILNDDLRVLKRVNKI